MPKHSSRARYKPNPEPDDDFVIAWRCLHAIARVAQRRGLIPPDETQDEINVKLELIVLRVVLVLRRKPFYDRLVRTGHREVYLREVLKGVFRYC